MMSFEEWMLKKKRMGRQWFITNVKDKEPYYEAYDKYRSRATRFEAEVILRDCRETAKELVALG